MVSTVFNAALNICKGLLFTIPVANAISDLVASIATVDGRSMQPTLNPNPAKQDFIFLNKWSRFNISRGDIVVMISPKDPHTRIVKRVIGLEGDTIGRIGIEGVYVHIPKGHIWVEGDHPGQSLDSNAFGAVPMGLVTAKVVGIVWPFERIQSLTNKNPF